MAPKSRETIHSDMESSDDEGVIKNLDYKPPNDFSLYKAQRDTVSTFDVDETVKHEVWLIRVPEGVSNDDLATMSITLPPTGSEESVSLGTLKKKEITSSSASTTTKYHLQTVSPESGFAGEMSSLHALVPDASKRGCLVQAPIGIKHHLALVAQPSIPSGVPLAQEILSRPISKREQPEGLEMRFKFMGADTQVPGAKLSGSGKKFAAEWAKVLEKRQRDYEEELLREQQEMEEEMEAEEEAQAQAEEDDDEAEGIAEEAVQESTVIAVEEEEEDVPVAAVEDKKRKVEDSNVDASESKKAKKDKKEKKDKKDKKEKKEKKEKKDKN
ncbi:hypothetical protein BGZ76_010972 [Entomortierella beljakovae]|nr:hypothetical protein BGZ76_010972 [Entomortierella beljakovae]